MRWQVESAKLLCVSWALTVAALPLLLGPGVAAAHDGVQHAPASAESKAGAEAARPGAVHGGHGNLADPTSLGGPFAMTDHTGRPVTHETYLGRPVVLFFGYSNCEETCPTTLPIIGAALDELGDGPNAPVGLFVGLDEKRDTPDAMRRFLEAIHPRLVGLSGTRRQIFEMARDFRVRREMLHHRPILVRNGAAPTHAAGHNAGPVIYHTSRIYLLDSAGRVRNYLYHDSSVDELVKHVRDLP